jgi:poly(beta-D-mannuronate) lyase
MNQFAMRFSSRRIFRSLSALPMIAALFAVSSARGANVLVSTVAQFNASLATNAPGDTIIMTNKTWTDADVLFKRNGTAAKPITLRAQTPGHVILSGNSRLRIAGNWLVVDGLRFQNGYYTNSDVIQFRENSSNLATNCALLNTALVNYNPPDGEANNKWISLYGLSNRVENCFIKGKTNLGTTLVVWLASGQTNFANYHIIRHNFFGSRPLFHSNGDESIRVGDSATSFQNSRTLVEENLFLDCNGDIEVISSKSCENIYRYNTFDSCVGTLTLRHGNRCTVQNNWFFGRDLPQTGGVRVIGEDHIVFNNYFDGLPGSGARAALCMMDGVVNSAVNEYFQVKRAQILFNTFVGCSNNFTIGQADGGGTLGPIDCTIANNLVRTTTGPLIKILTQPTNFLWEGNIFSGASVGLTNAGISTSNPLLILNSDGLWRPATNSPALGAATGSYPLVTDDFDGQSRGVLNDIGCDESSTNAMTRRPLCASEVGPSWMRTMGPIQTITPGSNSVTLTWPSLPGLVYQPQYSTNFTTWLKAGSAISNSLTTNLWTDDGSQTAGAPFTAMRRYYRIALVP